MPTVTSSAASAVAAASSLRGLCGGNVHLPGDPGYDQARRAWNLAVDQRPAAVTVPRTAEDVVAVVRAAGGAGLRVAVQSTGHGASDLPGALADAVLVRLDELTGVSIYPVARVARVLGGTQWRAVVEAAARHGLAARHGSSPDVAVTGYSLGGGLSWYARAHGLACSSVRAVELVTPDGRLVRADVDHEPELFWALRGGGGAFGVVTAIEFDLLELPDTYAGMLLWDERHAATVAHAWSRWTRTAPETATTSLRLMSFPPLPELPEFLRGRRVVIVDGVVLGDDPAAALAPLRALDPEIDTFGVVPPTAVPDIHMDPPAPVPGVMGHTLLDALPDEAVETLLATAGPASGSSLMLAELRHLGGALAVPAAEGGALDRVDGTYAFYCVAVAPTPAAVAHGRAETSAAVAAMAPYGRDRQLRNFSEGPDATRCFAPEVLARLRAVRRSVDPEARLVAGDWLAGQRGSSSSL